MKDLSGRIAALTPEQRAMFEALRKPQKKVPAGPPPGPIPRRGEPGPAPLSFDQERLWFLHQLDPQEAAYNIATVTRLRGALDVPRLAAALQEIVRRHEAWRTVLPAVDGRPVQIVLPHLAVPLPVIDLAALPEERRPALVLAKEEAVRPFDFEQGPLVRARLLRVAAEEHLCVLTVHHIVTDWVSFQLAWHELAAFYLAFGEGKPSPLPAPPIQYADFAVWQRSWMQGEALERYVGFWLQEIAGAPQALELPTDRPRPPFLSMRGGMARLRVPAERAEAFRAVARKEGATTFMALLAVWGALLERLTGAGKVLISSPNANRGRTETQGLLGFFLTQLVFATDVSGDPAFRELLVRTRGTALRAFSHQDLPFGKLIEAVRPERDPSRAPLVQVNLLVLDAEYTAFEMPGLALENVRLDEEVARFDLGLGVFEGSEGIAGFIEFNRDLFDRTTAERLARAFELVVDQVGRHPETRIAELDLLGDAARHQVLHEWNDTEVPEPAAPVHELVAAQAARNPGAVALVTPDGETTYGELDRRAGLLAAWLARQGIGREARVGLCLDRTADLAAGMLGIWKAGAAWVPLDPAYPADRLTFILEDAGLAAVVTSARPASGLPETQVPLLSLDSLEHAVFLPSPGGEGGDGRGAGGEGLAYVIYTSGTTGRPKGVLVEHGSLAHVLRASRRTFGWNAADRIPVLAPFSFDIFLFELWSPLTAGGTAELIPLAPALDLPCLLAGLEKATRLHAVPALMRQIVALGRAEGRRWPGVRTLFVGGDAVPPELLAELPEVFPSAEIRILYGPTEGTIICASLPANGSPWQDHGPKNLLGRPLPDAVIHLMDRSGGMAAIGVAGELWIGGAGVTRGYLGREELTAAKYVERDGRRWYRTGDLARRLPDGLLEFLGRVDEQVKVRGFRIEPGEIEAVLVEHPAVREAVVLAAEVPGGDKRLVAYVVPEAEGGPWAEAEPAVRAALARRLPDHMVPALFVALPGLPLTAHGKVDRRALLKLGTGEIAGPADATAPRSPVEEILAEIWSELLGVERVGVHDNFFRLGGDSILGIQVVARARRAGLVLTPRQIFESQTVAALAAVAVPVEAGAEPGEEGPVEGPVPLSPVQLRFLAEERADPHWFNQALLLDLRQPVEPALLERALAVVVERHDALRWVLTPGSSPAFIRGAVAVPFLVVDLSSLPEEAFSPAVEAASAQLQTAFDLQNGPVFLAALFPGTGGARRLLLNAHHLVIDAVSWRILLEDLQAAYGQLAAGAPAALPPRTTSWKRWAERLAAHAVSPAVRRELAHWLALPAPAPLPFDLPGTPEDDTAGAVAAVSVELPAEATAALLRTAPAVYRARGEDLLLAALVQAFAEWTGEPRLVLEMEGHGREEIGGGIDLSRTAGWFTTVYPVALDLGAVTGAGEAIKAVKEQLRAVPRKGMSYGLLRYLAGDRRLAARPVPAVGFNYLGQLDGALPAGGPFAPAPESAGRIESPRARRSHAITVDALVWEGRLKVRFGYPSRRLARATMEALAQGFSAALDGLIAHCLAPEAGGWTPSDLPLAHLSQGEVDALLGHDPAVEDVYPLSPLQSGMLFHTLYTPGSEIYFEQLTGTLHGPLDVDAFARAWQAVVDRQPALRAAFAWEGLARPLQIVRRGVAVPWTLEDWREEPDIAARFEAVVEADQGAGFDLARAPLLRLFLARTGEAEHRLLWSFHHLLFDGWCFAILFGEVFLFYEAFRRGRVPDLPPVRPYRDYLAWLDAQDPARAEAFWSARLAGLAAATPVPQDEPEAPAGRAVADFREAEIRLAPEQARALTRLAQEEGLTLNTLVQGAWALLLARWSGARDVVFGAVAAGRPADLPGVERMVGLFINTLPVRAVVEAEAPARDWLRRLQQEQVEQRAFEHSPLVDVQRWSGLPPGEPLFQSVLVFENYPIDPSLEGRLGELSIADVRVSERTSYPLTLAAVVREEFLLRLGFDARVAPETAVHVLTQLAAVLAALAAHPERALGELPALPEEDRLRALVRSAPTRPVDGSGSVELPRNAREETLSRVWRSVLRLERIGIHDDFFRLGGDSILSLQIVARARQEGLALTPREVFENPTIAALAEVARSVAADAGEEGAGETALAPVDRSSAAWTPADFPLARLDQAALDALLAGGRIVEDVYPVAPLQSGMIFHTLYAPGSEIYFEQLTGTLDGPLDADAFARAWQAVAERQPVLRTAYAWEGLEQPLQVVCRGVRIPWVFEDWRGEADPEARLRAFAAADRARGFDLAVAPLMRLFLVRTGEAEHRLLWSFHHLLFDGWCFSLLFREVFLLYEAYRRNEPVELGPVRPYRDYVAWLARQDAGRAESFWRRRLAGVETATPVPFDHPEQPGGREAADFQVAARFLPEPLARSIARLAQGAGLTANTVVQGAWAVLLARWSGRSEVVFGAVAAGRPAELPGIETMIGLFINTLPVRVELDPEAPVLPWLRRLQEEQVEQRVFEWSPLADVQRWSGAAPGAPLFHSLVVFENYPVDPSLGEKLGELAIRGVAISERTNYPLTLGAMVREGFHLTLSHDRRIEPATAERILDQLAAVLAAFAEDPRRALGTLPALPGEEELCARVTASAPRATGAAGAIGAIGAPEPPRNAVEETLVRIFGSVLRREPIGIHDDFFRLGGDSILSLQIVARARQEGLVLTPRQIFESPTIAGLAAVAEPAAVAPAPRKLPRIEIDPAVREAATGGDPSVEDLYPLAPLQKAMLLHGLYAPESPFYLEQLTCALHGTLDGAAFRGAWRRLMDRHPALRTAFAWQGLDALLQVVRRGVELPWEEEDWRGVPTEEQEARWRERVAVDGRKVFDLGRPPLQRLLLVRTGETEHHLLWSFHHLLFDGWCFSLLFRDLFQLYEALQHGEEPRLPEPPPYRDFIAWLAGHPAEPSEAWWRHRLEGFTAPSPLPLDGPESAEPGERIRHLSVPATAALESFAQSHRLTMSTLFQGAWALLLARYGAGRDVLFGSVVSGRPPELPGVESMVGLFINTLPLRLDVDPGAPAAAWLRGVQAAHLDLRPHEHVPAADVQSWSELPPGEPLFRSLTVFEKFPYEEAIAEAPQGLSVRDLDVHDRADVPLSAVAVPTGETLTLMIAHDHQSAPATVDRLLRSLEVLLTGLAADPGRPLGDVPLLAAAERSQLLAWGEEGWTAAAPVPEDGLPVHALFLRRAAERPAAPALLDMDGRVTTYGELAARAGRRAAELRALGAGPEARVAIWLDRSPRMLEAVLAVLLTGAAYVPIDPEAPPERVGVLLEDSGAVVVVTQEDMAGVLPAVGARVVLWGAKDQKDGKDNKDTEKEEGGAGSLLSLETLMSFSSSSSSSSSPSLDHLAYVLYTSGSTGTPKGVLVSHRSLAAYTRAICGIYGIGPADRAIQFASLSFDASAEEIFTALASGASLLVRSGPAEDAASFLRRAAERGLTLVSLPTAYWHLLAAALESGEVEWPAGVRLVVMGGERALPERWAGWGRGGGLRPRLFNAYGPTEATIAATLEEHPGGPLGAGAAGREVPIGRPLPGWRAHVLDAELRPLPVGAVGELCLGGVGLARGYLGDPARTAERFVPDPLREDGERLYRTGDRARRRADGTLEFAGRLDAQVKVRGFRIELGEVEAALAAHPAVREAAAVTRADVAGNARLFGFVVWRTDAADLTGLLSALQRRLPIWMVPSEIVPLSELPVTAAGKLDRRALVRLIPEAGGAGREIRPPGNAVEEGMAEIWREILGVERVGLDDDFFSLGGDSLLATQLVSRVRQRFGVELPLHNLFTLRTLEALARDVLDRTLDAGEPEDLDRLLEKLDGLSEEEVQALLAAEEGAEGGEAP